MQDVLGFELINVPGNETNGVVTETTKRVSKLKELEQRLEALEKLNK